MHLFAPIFYAKVNESQREKARRAHPDKSQIRETTELKVHLKIMLLPLFLPKAIGSCLRHSSWPSRITRVPWMCVSTAVATEFHNIFFVYSSGGS